MRHNTTQVELYNGDMREKTHLHTSHQEADAIILQKVVHLAGSGKMSIRVVADDTYVLVLLILGTLVN
jgi:hypothetical protein